MDKWYEYLRVVDQRIFKTQLKGKKRKKSCINDMQHHLNKVPIDMLEKVKVEDMREQFWRTNI